MAAEIRDLQINPIELYTDGSCLGNPGPGGLSYYTRYWYRSEKGDIKVNETEGSRGFRKTTNNRMEVMAAIYGLIDIAISIEDGTFRDISQINIYSDSKYLVDAVNKRWIDLWISRNWMTIADKPVKNRDLWEQLMAVLTKLKSMGLLYRFQHVDGHSGLVWNDRVDELAVLAARDSSKHEVDKNYEDK